MVQLLFAILAGILTVGAPCILPLLPILLGASVGQKSKTRPLFIALGFIVMFSITGLTLSFIVQSLNIAPDTLRNISVVALILFGAFMLWPKPFELLTQKLVPLSTKARGLSSKAGSGNFGGFILGLILGIIWTPCAGPILGSILTLIATQTELARASILLVGYAIGAGIPMVIIAYGGQYITTKIRWISRYAARLQQIFGILIVILAIAMFFQYDLVIQAKLLDIFPSWNFANLELFYNQ
ncbi:MAG: cytochrome C biogenesis protein [Candidatus Doudnabacteria bacterium CG10_big_fil_rev_8_21_14_0_10_42_18]|uniref:Cytochrome C biogenesis protein n=1 Tax=Candidatus Doudnabacteria bacterium CG10_big_fil_rev_8_21_14_0_10_42_18 TaxID=1974552 RepID=A0A2H0VA16_9BACT|nr:MAG: cytochrome C biogenesis protein [Candidatus Doudnabacteria bacterium CG10_big_fil_rev_8_21_14_0_10_42_18]